MFLVNWCQHPVGHGGFHTGVMRVDKSMFSWIFDCGSRQEKRLNFLLENWTNHLLQPVDWLFISHFDKDHVSGLNTLMSRSRVRDVMVPYVNERELAYALLYEISRNNLDRFFVELVADPAIFFASRGADRITFLGGNRADEGGIGEPPDDTKPEGDWRIKIQPPPRSLRKAQGTQVAASIGAQVQIVHDSQCDIEIRMGEIGIRLKPYRAPVAPNAHSNLVKELKSLVGTFRSTPGRPGLGRLAYAIANHARTATGRASLRSLFKRHVGSSNRSSLSLLSAPYVPYPTDSHWGVDGVLAWSRGRGSSVAWLNTGDAELLNQADVSNWHSRYAMDLDAVRMLALPHHGSDKNSNATLQQLCPGATLAVHVKSSAKKHPGPFVTAAAGHRLSYVTEQPGSQLSMWFSAP